MTTPWQAFKNAMASDAKIWHAIPYVAEKADKETAAKRYSICLECPELTEHTHQCKQCMCFMKIKTTISHASCPLKKW